MNSLFSVGAQIHSARKAAQLSQAELAQRCSISRNTLIKLESGNGNVELNTLLAICDELQIEIKLVAGRIAAMPGDASQTSDSPIQKIINRRMLQRFGGSARASEKGKE